MLRVDLKDKINNITYEIFSKANMNGFLENREKENSDVLEGIFISIEWSFIL